MSGASHLPKEVVTTRELVDTLREEAPECPRGYCGYCIACLMQAAATEIEDTMAKSRDLARLRATLQTIASDINREPGNLHGDVLQSIARRALNGEHP